MNTARFLKYVWPFYNIMHERVNKFKLEIMNKNDGCSSLLGMEIWSCKYCLIFKARQILSFNIGLPMF